MRRGLLRRHCNRHISGRRRFLWLPFKACREACAAAPSKAAVQKRLNDFIRRHLGQYLAKSLVTACSDILLDNFRIDDTTVSECYSVLLFIEIGIRQSFDTGRCDCLAVEEPGDNTAL